MSQQWSEESFRDSLKQLLRRAAIDPTFRQKCLESAQGAIQEISGQDVSREVPVRFVEELEELVFVLPKQLTGADGLTVEDLRSAAGGDDGGPERGELVKIRRHVEGCLAAALAYYRCVGDLKRLSLGPKK